MRLVASGAQMAQAVMQDPVYGSSHTLLPARESFADIQASGSQVLGSHRGCATFQSVASPSAAMAYGSSSSQAAVGSQVLGSQGACATFQSVPPTARGATSSQASMRQGMDLFDQLDTNHD